MQSDDGNDKHIILNIFVGGLIRSSLEAIEGGLGSTPYPPSPPGLVAGRKKDRTYVPTLLIVQNHVSEVAVDYDMATENMSTLATFKVVNYPANTTLNSEISAGYSCKKKLQTYFLDRNSSKVK